MRRRFGFALIVLALLASSCNGGRETPAFSVPDSVEGQITVPDIVATPVCRFAIGAGMGVEVVSVEPEMPVSQFLQPGDVITQIDGVGVSDSGDFIGIVRARQVGDRVTVSVIRGDTEPFEADIELVEHVDGSGAPMVGIGVRTAVELREAAAIEASGRLDSPLTSVVSVEGSLYAVDAVEGAWLSLDSSTPSVPWTPAAGSIYILEDGQPDQVVSVTGPSSSVDFEVEGWNGRRVLGSQAGRILVYADRPHPESGVEGAIFAVDPASGGVLWFWSPAGEQSTDRPLPIFAVSSPSQDRTLVGTAQFDEAGNAEFVRFSLLDLNGEPELVVPPTGGELPAGLVTIGWYTDSEIAYQQPDTMTIVLWNVDTGDLTELTLPVTPDNAQFSPVGDGTHLIMITSDALDLVKAGEGPSARPLAVDCAADQIAPPGYVG